MSLLTHAVVHNPKPGFDKNGDPGAVLPPGEFPSANDPEFDVPDDARVVYKQGELPVVLKNIAPRAYNMRVPFSYTPSSATTPPSCWAWSACWPSCCR